MPLVYEGNTAFIKFNSFEYDPNQVFGPNGIRPEAWQRDSFMLVKMCLDQIREDNKANSNKITNIVLDLTHNTGGTISALVSILGLMTNEDVLIPTMNSQNNLELVESYKVDADLDKDFTDDDAYTEFNYNILVSELSFSCGNYLPVVARDMNLAKLIGRHTGGGMCSVGNINLLDGTTVRISSNKQLRTSQRDSKGNLIDTEFGIDPDYELTVDQLWDYKYIDNLINTSAQ